MLTFADLAEGLALLVPVLAACALAAWRAEGGRTGDGVARLLALMVLFTAALIAVHLVPGVLGVLTPAAVLATAALLAIASLRLRAGAAIGGAGGPDGRAGPVAAAVALLVAGCGLALVRDLAGAPVTAIDALNFQVPIVGRWLQSDSVWGLHQFIPDYSNATYPMHGNVLVSAFVLPFDSAFLARLVAVPYWALGAVGAFAVARELGAPRSGAVLAASALAALPVSVRAGLEGVQTDAPMMAVLAAGVLFLVRHARTGARHELVLAAVALGLAFGTKWYAVTGVALVLAVWTLARGRGGLLDSLRVGVLVIAVGGFWLLRNWIETGNPLFPQAVGPFDAPPDTLRELGGHTLADYALEPGVWRDYLRPAFASSFAWTGAALAAGVAGAALRRPRGPVLAVLAATIGSALLYAVTPYSAFGPEGRPVLAAASTRYGLPALLGAAVLTAWALGGLRGRLRVAAEALLALAVLDGLRRGFGELSAAKAIGGTLVVAAAVAVLSAWRPRGRAAVGLAVLVGLAGLVAVDATRRRANGTGYGRFDPTVAWLERHAPDGARVGLAGTWSTDGVSPVLPAFGPRFGNRVEFVGEFRDGMLRAYTAPQPFQAALRGRDLLFVGRGAPPRPAAAEEQWALDSGWRPVAESERLVLLRSP